MSIKLKLNDVENIIPKENYKHPQKDLRNQYIEWCLKKYEIDSKIYVTISIKYPKESNIIYIDSDGNQCVYDVDKTYDVFIVNETYWYATC